MYKNLPFERVALLLQGGGALGSYQAGVYQAFALQVMHQKNESIFGVPQANIPSI